MFATQHRAWNEWTEVYRGFSETVGPYREAQWILARSVVAASGEDVGGGTGNTFWDYLRQLLRGGPPHGA
jgi:hypothetical protein